MSPEPLIVAEGVNHHFGSGDLRKQILFDVTAEIRPGEIVIMTGPSGSGKTTLLTLIGALRSTQEGSLSVLGQELKGASRSRLVQVRRCIGYVFQAHNLLDSLTARRNVEMSLYLHGAVSRRDVRKRAEVMLESVGLAERVNSYPAELSAGQKQRVAIVRALVTKPRVILADEPTAALDKHSGRDVVDLMHDLAKKENSTVLLVTHDNRILDVADRIIHMEDGRLSSFTNAVLSDNEHMMEMLIQNNRGGELCRQVEGMALESFGKLLKQVTGEFQHFLRASDVVNNQAFETVLDQVLESFTLKIGELLDAERATLFLLDEPKGELWSKVAKGDGSEPLEIRIPSDSGIVGHVVTTGQARNVTDVESDPLFNRQVDRATGYKTRTLLCAPLLNRRSEVFGAIQLVNKRGGRVFDGTDEGRLSGFASSLGVILESWRQMRESQGHANRAGVAQ